jgi:hypothetical protein
MRRPSSVGIDYKEELLCSNIQISGQCVLAKRIGQQQEVAVSPPSI